MTLPFNDKYTPVPNILFDLMPHISNAQFSVLLAIVRKTYGWQKVSDTISLSQFVSMTGLSNYGVRQALAVLLDHGFVARRTVGKQNHEYTILLAAVQMFMEKLCNSVAQLDSELCNSVAQLGERVCNSVAQPEGKLCNSVATQKKELKEKELKESVSSSSFSSLGESESRVSNTLQAESELLKAPTPKDDNRSPDAAIAHTLQAWQNIRGGTEKRGEKKTLRDLCAKHGAQNVYRAIIAAKDAGKTDGVGWVKWWAENKAAETPAVDYSKYGGGTPDYMRDDYNQEVKTYAKMKVDGSMYGAPDKIVFMEETRVNGKLTGSRPMPDGFVPPNQVPAGLMASTVGTIAPSGGLRRAVAASVASGVLPVGTYTGPAENLP